MDQATAGAVAAAVFAVVGLTKFLIPEGKNQNNIVRLYSALLGLAFGALAVAQAGTPVDLMHLALPAEQGFLIGAGVTAAVKGTTVVLDSRGLSITPAPEAPAVLPVPAPVVPAPAPAVSAPAP